jgi:hypothetical protein
MNQDLSTMQLAFKNQTGLGVPAAGAGAYGLNVLPSTGLAKSIAAIESALIKQNKMKNRPRHGTSSATAAYETELSVGPLDPVFENVLGCNAVPKITVTNATLGTATFTAATNSVATTLGSWLTAGVAVGMFVKFTGTTNAANNGKWFPVIGVTALGLTFAPGYVADGAVTGGAWSVDIAKSFATPAQYIDKYSSVEEYMPNAAFSKFGTDMRWHSLTFGIAPKQYARVSMGLTGRDMTIKSGGAAPVFPAPTYIAGDSLILLDGGIFVSGIRRADVTGLTLGLSANVNTTDVVSSRVVPDVRVGQFGFTGSFASVIADGTDFTTFDAETDISVLLHLKEKNTERFVGLYIGYASFGGYGSPMAGEGLAVQTMTLMAGEDDLGVGHLPTTFLISTSD